MDSLIWKPWDRTNDLDEWTTWDESHEWFLSINRDGPRWNWYVAYNLDEEDVFNFESSAASKRRAIAQAKSKAERLRYRDEAA